MNVHLNKCIKTSSTGEKVSTVKTAARVWRKLSLTCAVLVFFLISFLF